MFKISEAQLNQVLGCLGEFPGKATYPIIKMLLEQLPKIEEAPVVTPEEIN